MTDFLQLLFSGLATGAIYGLAALGFTLLWQASGTINFAQGEFVMLPAFAMLAFSAAGLPLPIAFIVTLLVQCATMIWWANGITKDSEDHNRRIAQIEAQRTNERIGILESQVNDARGALSRIETKLDRLIESKGK